MRALIVFSASWFFINVCLGQEGMVPDSVERHALEQLYHATSGDQWDFNDGWLSEEEWPNWYGVFMAGGDVVSLDLSFNSLEGELPDELYELVALEELILEYNNIEGPISSNISQLIDLTWLSLRSNQMSGELPASIMTLSELQILDLFDNKFGGPIPTSIGNLDQLIELHLAFNSFGGSLPESMGSLMNLEVLNLNDNLFEGEIPASLGNLSRLYDIILDYNLFTGEIPASFVHLISLEYFSVAYNQFEGVIPQFFANLPIRGLWVFGNNFYGIPDFSNHSDPESLIISVDENKLDFGDLEPNWTSEGSIFEYPRYSPQDSVNTYFNLSEFTYSVEVGGQYNQYQWLKNGQEIAGATSEVLALNGGSYVDTDRYQCRVTNTRITDLTLWSKAKSIKPGKYYAVADGDWNQLIWSREESGPLAETVPGEGSEVFIIGKNVTLTDDLVTGPVHVIVEGAGASLVVDGAEMTVVGTLDLTKETEGYPGNVQVINGGKIIPVNQ